MKEISLIFIILLFIGCNSTEQYKVQTTKKTTTRKFKPQKIENPYQNLNDKEKLSALTNYFVKKELNIAKPIYPKKPSKPTIKKAKSIVKGRFEKTSDFERRVKLAKQKREKYIESIENRYKQDVLIYNKQVKNITKRYNDEIKKLKNNIYNITVKAMQKAYNIVYGKPILKSIDYDADNEIYYGKLTSSNGNFSKKIAIKIPPYIAQNFYDSKKSPKVIYEYKNNKIYLKDIKVPYKGKDYLAMLTNTDYKSSDIKVAINTRALNLKTADLLNSTFKASNSDFNLGDIDYGKSKVARLNSKDLQALNTQRLAHLKDSTEDLSSLLNSAKPIKKNPKAYAIIFGIQDYMLETNVNYSQNSAMSFMQYASKLLGVPDDNIWAFVGNKTTSGFIKSQWKDFLSMIEPGSTVYFYYSGHGVPGSDGNAYILPSDTSAEVATNDKTFMLKNIYSNLSKTKAKKIIAFVDSCFSGKDDKGKLLFDGVAPVLRVKKTTFDKSKMTIFTAGSSSEFSNQYKQKHQRLFSYFLMKGLAKGKINTKELYSYIRKNVANKSRRLGVAYKQIPQLMGKENGDIR